MTFVVTYRGKDGALREESAEAAGRAECVVAMKARGIVPLSVREGTGGRNRRDSGSPYCSNELRHSRYGNVGNSTIVHSTIWRTAILATLMLVVAGGAWWWLGRPPRASRPAEGDDVVATQAVARVEKPKSEPASVVTNVPVSNALPAQHKTYLGQAVVSHSCVTNADGSVRELIRTADGKLHGIRRPPPESEPIFHNAADQAIAMVLSVSDTVSAAPLPGLDGNLDEEFAKAVKTPIEINDEESRYGDSRGDRAAHGEGTDLLTGAEGACPAFT